jgi:hypothetical protein
MVSATGQKCIRGFLRCLVMLVLLLISYMGAYAAEFKDGIVGDYQLRGVMETASGFRLSSNGAYQFFLIYGSADETDVGTWQLKDSTVILHTTAPNNDPLIEFLRSSKDDFDGVRVHFEGEGAALATLATTVVLSAHGREFRANEVSNNYKQSRSAAPPIQKISVSFFGAMRVYRPFEFEPLDPSHNNYVFRATTGNYGSVRFDGTRLQIGDNELFLMLPNMTQRFRYVREKAGSESAP